MNDRYALRQSELAHLAAVCEKHPELFLERTFVENDAALSEFGVRIPGKDLLPTGMVKLWPEDFIVEEISLDGAVREITGSPAVDELAEGTTVYATLVKCGLSTIQAAEDIARQLGIRKEQIAYAGIKDKDAITGQRISMRGTSLERAAQVSSPYFFLRDLASGKGAMEKGRLRGNRFTILVRTPDSLREGEAAYALSRALRSTHERGFYNFFYLQRFGTPRLRNFLWAKDLMLGRDEAALLDFLTYPATREIGYFKEIRGAVRNAFGNWDEVRRILDPFPLLFEQELKIVDHLRAHPEDIGGAFQTIPEQLTMWMYALTSFFFNQKISQHLMRGEEPPSMLPFFLSPDRAEQELYRDLLEPHGLYPVPLKNLRRFPMIQVRSRLTATRDKLNLTKGEVIDEGLVLQFELGKGQYATTYLSHLFNLVAGKPPECLPSKRTDTRELLGLLPIADTISRFDSIIGSKEESILNSLRERDA